MLEVYRSILMKISIIFMGSPQKNHPSAAEEKIESARLS